MKLPFLPPLAVMVLAVTVSLAPACHAEQHIVEIRDFGFIPDKISVRPGDTITWVNRDIVPHTATAQDGSWDTGEIMPNGYKTQEFLPQYSGPYFCRYHPAMRGAL